MQVIREKMRERTHFYQKELVQNAFIGFLLDLGNIMLSKKDRLIRPTLSRKEELFEQFLQLLFEHCKEQHVVTFYAERLFITPQYLSLILKELTGKSANKWIDDALIVENSFESASGDCPAGGGYTSFFRPVDFWKIL